MSALLPLAHGDAIPVSELGGAWEAPVAVLAAAAVALTAVSWLLLALSSWCVVEALGLGLGFSSALLVVIATNLALVIPSLPAAIGVFEAAAIVALQPYGIGTSRALSSAIVLHALNVLPFLAAGPFVFREHLVLVRRRRLERLYSSVTTSSSGV
jgi:uncharacterized membrane protein YbhN (UPF0104 family)